MKRLELVNEDGEVYCFERIGDKINVTLNWRTEKGEQMSEHLMFLTKPLTQQLKKYLNQIDLK